MSMKVMKVVQYLVSLIHLGLQIFYFIQWNNRMGALTTFARKLDATVLSNANLAVSQESFVYLGLAMITLAFYITISVHIATWIAENRMEKIMEQK